MLEPNFMSIFSIIVNTNYKISMWSQTTSCPVVNTSCDIIELKMMRLLFGEKNTDRFRKYWFVVALHFFILQNVKCVKLLKQKVINIIFFHVFLLEDRPKLIWIQTENAASSKNDKNFYFKYFTALLKIDCLYGEF